MPTLPSRTFLAALAATLIVVLAPGSTSAQGMTPEAAFADGNRLFREGLYWAALLRYEQAAEAGMDTPLLHYNSGVAHYRARQYEAAMAAFEQSAVSPILALLSHYNLGLAAHAAGDNEAALGWLLRARDQDADARISRLADDAIGRIRRELVFARVEAEESIDEEPARELDRQPRPFAEYDLFASAGFGSDDNAYRTPGGPYLDQSDPDQPVVVDPVVQSGSFVPVRLGAIYLINSFEHESFFARYRGFGRFYADEELKNANEYIQEIAIGTEYRKEREDRSSYLFSAFTVAQHDETFYDPDDGGSRLVDSTDIGDRYSYLRYGPEISTLQSWGRFAFRLWGKAQLWNYENTEAVPEYDHEYFHIGSSAQYRFTKTSLLRFTAEGSMRNFSDRPSFSLDGRQLISNPAVEYTYVDYGAMARQRLTGSLWFGVKYVFTDRRDQYVGYNDYTRDSFGAEIHLGIGNDFDLDIESLYRIYNFANAYAYNNVAADRKTLETVDSRLGISYRMPWNLRLVGDYSYKEVASNDARIAYDRSQFMLSLEWNYE